MCVSGFSSEKTTYGQSALHFILSKYFIWILHFLQHFSSFASIFDNMLPTIHNKMFRVGGGGRGNLGRVRKPETHNIIFLALLELKVDC